MRAYKSIWKLAFLCGALVLFFLLLSRVDNKYRTPPPYGRDGIISLTEEDINRSQPIFLIDGWLLSDERAENLPTWIGEFSNLRRGNVNASAHGGARYELTLRYSGAPTAVSVDFPELFRTYQISLDGQVLASGGGSARVTFALEPGDHQLAVETLSYSGFYSGIYYPPALGLPEMLDDRRNVQSFAYAVAFLAPLVLALFTLCLWRGRNDRTAFWFGLLCCFFSLYVAYYWVDLFHLPLGEFWNLAEEAALCGLCFCVVRLAALAAGTAEKTFRAVRAAFVAVSVCLLVLNTMIPVMDAALPLHGALKNGYFVGVFCIVACFALRCGMQREKEYRYILAGSVVFGVGLLFNLFSSNQFEPILLFWQFEWCGLFLVGLFGAMMVARNRRILAENEQFENHLEQLVEQRTEELRSLLAERKAFFADMAHDLKAPLFATKGFIEAIRANDTGIDSELRYYLDQVEIKQREMTRRLQGLNTVNELDKIKADPERISVMELLREVYATHHAETEVASVHLIVTPPEQDRFLTAQLEKLSILFENLIYNALRATEAEGSIFVCALAKENAVQIIVTDTGCGIAEEELPHIFQRFFVGERNRETGTGLGLYIVHSIVTELGGSISVTSRSGEGTSFIMEFPADSG